MKRSAFTMIELIFVIVILGILAAIAIPKLSATRDDAIKTTKIADTKTCISDFVSSYQGKGILPSLSDFKSCTSALESGASISVEDDDLLVSNSGHDDLDGTHTFKGLRVKY